MCATKYIYNRYHQGIGTIKIAITVLPADKTSLTKCHRT